ncbi:MAG: extensin family protein [Pseudomonadota bacterium]
MVSAARVVSVSALLFLGSCSVFTGQDGDQNLIVTRGAICGTPAIQGVELGAVKGPGRCGFTDAVEVDAVGGVLLSQPSKMRCDTARALNAWVTDHVVPTVGKTGGGVKTIDVAADYACRRRNNKSSGRLSEHSFGKAIDISAFQLADGSALTVASDWRRGDKGKLLRALHQSACGPFGTVLGPDSDRHHKSHFHFDTADYRSGPYCR